MVLSSYKMDSSISTIFNAIIATAVTILVTVENAVRSISSWKRKYVGSISLNSFHFKDDVIEIYEKKTGKTFTTDMCTTLVVYIKNNMIQFFNPKDNFKLMEFKFSGLTYDQDTFGISEDGLTFFSRDQDNIVISTMCAENKGILPVNKTYAKGYFNRIIYSLFSCHSSSQITTPQHNKFCFNKSCESFALVYNGVYKSYDGELKQMTKNGKTQLTIHNSFTGSVKRLIEIDIFGVNQMKFSDDGVYIALVTSTSTLMIYNTLTGKLVKSIVNEDLNYACPYKNNICWSPDSNKIVVTVSRVENERIAYSTIICFSNIFAKTTAEKFVISDTENCVNIGNWDDLSETICFYAGKNFYTFNFDTKAFVKKTIVDNLTDYISTVNFVSNDLMVIERAIKETAVFKDKTYKSGMNINCPPDNEVPYIDIVRVK